MAKLKNTRGNKLKVLAGCVAGFAVLGYLFGKGADKKQFAIGGAVVGLIATSGISSWLIEPKKN